MSGVDEDWFIRFLGWKAKNDHTRWWRIDDFMVQEDLVRKTNKWGSCGSLFRVSLVLAELCRSWSSQQVVLVEVVKAYTRKTHCRRRMYVTLKARQGVSFILLVGQLTYIGRKNFHQYSIEDLLKSRTVLPALFILYLIFFGWDGWDRAPEERKE